MAYKAKLNVVPNDEPKSEGDWLEVFCDEDRTEKLKTLTAWNDAVDLFKDDVPDNHHLVQVDLRFVLELRQATRTMRFDDE